MKKILLSFLIALSLVKSALCSETPFYIRTDIGASMLPKDKINADLPKKLKIKSSTNVLANVGIGTYLIENLRAELKFTKHSTNVRNGTYSKVDGTISTLQKTKQKFSANSIMLKGLYDIYDFSPGKLFISAAIGSTKFSEKLSTTKTETGGSYSKKTTSKAKVKNTVNLAWAIGTGVSFDITNNIKMELAYNYFNFGKNKKIGNLNYGGNKFASQDLSLGVIYDL